MMDLSFYQGKTVLLTGHTGFKGSWMCKVLSDAGANVVGYSLKAPTVPSLFEIASIERNIISITGDVRDLKHISDTFKYYKPDIAIHMAAQPLVTESYSLPAETYDINVMGTVNFLEAVRSEESVKSVVNVTTDKVYKNDEWVWGYRENDVLDGYDPYSNSKSCSELVTATYKRSFFDKEGVAVSTCRAGNVIGGGDFAKNRIIPDCVRAMQENKVIEVRNPYSVRPYQHVLEPVFSYLMIAESQFMDPSAAGNYNIGPEDADCVTTGRLVDIFCDIWGNGASWKNISMENACHEAGFLKLDCSLVKKRFNWKPVWNISDALEKTVEWSKQYLSGGDTSALMSAQIEAFKGNE